eukprot:s2112_g10.t1
MPLIAPTDFVALAALAEKWLDRPDRVAASKLTAEQRRADPAAAAAWAICTFQNKSFQQACGLCGTWTACWCEGCYAAGDGKEDWQFSALRTACEDLKLTCRKCGHRGITWEAGRRAYEARSSDGILGEVEVVRCGDGTYLATGVKTPRGNV